MEDTAYGCIPVRTLNDQKEVLLVCKKNPDGSSWWGLPKGHAEAGETPVAAAKRELWEETGIEDCVIDESKQYTDHYEFERDGQRIKKTVTYFYTTVAPTEPVDVDRTEVVDYRWRPAAEAHEYATYDELKALLKTAL